MNSPESQERNYTDRPPKGLREVLLANSRPQPAIPAVFVCLMFVIAPLVLQGWQINDGTFLAWAVAGGIAVSCGLAIAAGFCSVFPPVAWVAMAGFVVMRANFNLLPSYHSYLLIAGLLLAAAMFFFQIWRVRQEKFVPTIREYSSDL